MNVDSQASFKRVIAASRQTRYHLARQPAIQQYAFANRYTQFQNGPKQPDASAFRLMLSALATGFETAGKKLQQFLCDLRASA
jgi:hypothetical protein